MYLSSGHALWGATLQQHLLLESHLPPQRLLLKVLPQVYSGRHRCSQQLVKAASRQQSDTLFILLTLDVTKHTHIYSHTHQAKPQKASVTKSFFFLIPS